MDCAEFQARLPATMSHGRQDGSRAVLADHAIGCNSCRRTLQQWEEAQRAIETAFGTGKLEPAHFSAMTETLFTERFGTSLDLKRPAGPAPGHAPLPMPLLVAAAAGLLVGYLIWGSGDDSRDPLSQLMLQQAIANGNMNPGWLFTRGGMSGMLGTATGFVRDLFGIFLVIWVCRSRIWSVLFPISLPGSLYLARRAAVLLVIAGVYKVAGDVLVGPATMFLTGAGFHTLSMVPFLTIGWVVASVVWQVGFWLLLFSLLFGVVENLGLAYLKGHSPSPRPD